MASAAGSQRCQRAVQRGTADFPPRASSFSGYTLTVPRHRCSRGCAVWFACRRAPWFPHHTAPVPPAPRWLRCAFNLSNSACACWFSWTSRCPNITPQPTFCVVGFLLVLPRIPWFHLQLCRLRAMPSMPPRACWMPLPRLFLHSLLGLPARAFCVLPYRFVEPYCCAAVARTGCLNAAQADCFLLYVRAAAALHHPPAASCRSSVPAAARCFHRRACAPAVAHHLPRTGFFAVGFLRARTITWFYHQFLLLTVLLTHNWRYVRTRRFLYRPRLTGTTPNLVARDAHDAGTVR